MEMQMGMGMVMYMAMEMGSTARVKRPCNLDKGQLDIAVSQVVELM